MKEVKGHKSACDQNLSPCGSPSAFGLCAGSCGKRGGQSGDGEGGHPMGEGITQEGQEGQGTVEYSSARGAGRARSTAGRGSGRPLPATEGCDWAVLARAGAPRELSRPCYGRNGVRREDDRWECRGKRGKGKGMDRPTLRCEELHSIAVEGKVAGGDHDGSRKHVGLCDCAHEHRRGRGQAKEGHLNPFAVQASGKAACQLGA